MVRGQGVVSARAESGPMKSYHVATMRAKHTPNHVDLTHTWVTDLAVRLSFLTGYSISGLLTQFLSILIVLEGKYMLILSLLSTLHKPTMSFPCSTMLNPAQKS